MRFTLTGKQETPLKTELVITKDGEMLILRVGNYSIVELSAEGLRRVCSVSETLGFRVNSNGQVLMSEKD